MRSDNLEQVAILAVGNGCPGLHVIVFVRICNCSFSAARHVSNSVIVLNDE